jgi:hypothetical protein
LERSGVSEYRNREEVMDFMLRARTLEECERARELAIRWIEEHPADQDYILLAGEHLERVRQALLENEEGGGVSAERRRRYEDYEELGQRFMDVEAAMTQLQAQLIRMFSEEDDAGRLMPSHYDTEARDVVLLLGRLRSELATNFHAEIDESAVPPGKTRTPPPFDRPEGR